MRNFLSVSAGVVLWTALWIPFTMSMEAAFPGIIDPTRFLGHLPTLLSYVIASFIFSLAAGYLTALIARSRPIRQALVLGVVQLSLGVAFEVSYWNLLPVWYHVVFLALLIPGNVLGGVLRAGRRQVRVAA